MRAKSHALTGSANKVHCWSESLGKFIYCAATCLLRTIFIDRTLNVCGGLAVVSCELKSAYFIRTNLSFDTKLPLNNDEIIFNRYDKARMGGVMAHGKQC